MRCVPLPGVSRFGRLRTFEQRSKPSRIVSHDRSELIDCNPQSRGSPADRALSRKRCQTVALLHVWFLRRDIYPGRFSPSPGPLGAERAFDPPDVALPESQSYCSRLPGRSDVARDGCIWRPQISSLQGGLAFELCTLMHNAEQLFGMSAQQLSSTVHHGPGRFDCCLD